MQLILKFEKFLKFVLISIIIYLVISLGITIIHYFNVITTSSQFEDFILESKNIYLKRFFSLIFLFIPVITLIFISLRSILNEKNRILKYQDSNYEMFITQGYFKTFGLLLNNLKVVMLIFLVYTISSMLYYIYLLSNTLIEIFSIYHTDIVSAIIYALFMLLNLVFTVIFTIKTIEIYKLNNNYKYLKLNGYNSEDNNYIKPIFNLIIGSILIIIMILLSISNLKYYYFAGFILKLLNFIVNASTYALLAVGPILIISSFVSSKKFRTSKGVFTNNILETSSQLYVFLIINFASMIIYVFLIFDLYQYFMRTRDFLNILIILISIIALIYNVINYFVSINKDKTNS